MPEDDRLAVQGGGTDRRQLLAAFELPGGPECGREAMRRVAAATAELELGRRRRDSLETAVREAVANAVEHGNLQASELPVAVAVTATPDRLSVAITDRGGGTGYLDTAEEPDVEAKLRGDQALRGWGLFLIRSLVDEVSEVADGTRHTLILEVSLAH